MTKPALLSRLGLGDPVAREESVLDELVEVRPEPLLDLRRVLHCRQSPEPFGAHVVVALLELELRPVAAVIEIGEVEEGAHVERLSDGAKLLHQGEVQAGEMILFERADDRLGESDGAGLDRVAGELAALDENLGEDVERVLDVPAVLFFEMGADKRVVNFVQGAGELLAVAAAPFLAADEPADLPPGEGDFVADGSAVVGVLLEERDEYLVRQRAGLPEARVGADGDVPLGLPPSQTYLVGALGGRALVVTEEGAGDAQQGALHEELLLWSGLASPP